MGIYSNITCYNCHEPLYGKPKINIENRIYCFKCAKKIVHNLNELKREIAYQDLIQKKQEYDLRKQNNLVKYNDWHSKRYDFVRKGRLGFYPLCLIISTIGIVSEIFNKGTGFVVFILSAIAAYKISEARTNNKISEFEKNNPPPTKFTECEPKNDFKPVTHFILGADGSKFKTVNYREEVLKRDNFQCQKCRNISLKLEVHHIIPRAFNGSDDPTNLITLCIYCHDREDWHGHVRKHPTTLVEYVCIKSSKKYHYSYCSSIYKIKSDNTEIFFSVEEAEKAGYIRCRLCRPK